MSDHPGSVSKTTADLIYDSFYVGAIGGSVVALFFLLVDIVNGQPLFTPSLMGSVLFGGVTASSVTEVRMEMVAYYSIVHFVLFAGVGTFVSFLVHEVELHSRQPGSVLIVLFVLLEAGFFMIAAVFLPGVLAVLGAFRVALANFLAAGGMALFLVKSHRPDVWQRLKHAVSPG